MPILQVLGVGPHLQVLFERIAAFDGRDGGVIDGGGREIGGFGCGHGCSCEFWGVCVLGCLFGGRGDGWGVCLAKGARGAEAGGGDEGECGVQARPA